MAGRFTQRAAFVTGGAKGIGAAIVRLIVRDGGAAVIADPDSAAGEALAAALGERALFCACDVSDDESVRASVAKTLARFGRLDILVNNAAIFTGMGQATPDLDPAVWDRVLAVTLGGVFRCARAAIPAMRRQGAGAIVNVASVSGLGGDFSFPAYNAAKGGVVNYTRSLAVDHGPDGIRANCVCPGPVVTSRATITRPEVEAAFMPRIPLRRYNTPDMIAEAVAFLASDAAAGITGAILPVDGGISAQTGQPDLRPFLGEAYR